MKVEVVLTEADIAMEFAEAIEARDLPEKFFRHPHLKHPINRDHENLAMLRNTQQRRTWPYTAAPRRASPGKAGPALPRNAAPRCASHSTANVMLVTVVLTDDNS